MRRLTKYLKTSIAAATVIWLAVAGVAGAADRPGLAPLLPASYQNPALGSAAQLESTEPVPPEVVEQPYFDLDAYLDAGAGHVDCWHWQLLPPDLIYKSYLAGMKEPRSGTTVTHIGGDGWLWEGVMGARVGMLRYGDHASVLPQGFQLDVEGAASVRLDVDSDVNVRATDYRVGIPLTYGIGCTKPSWPTIT